MYLSRSSAAQFFLAKGSYIDPIFSFLVSFGLSTSNGKGGWGSIDDSVTPSWQPYLHQTVRGPFPAFFFVQGEFPFFQNIVDGKFQDLGQSKTWHFEVSAVQICRGSVQIENYDRVTRLGSTAE